MRPEISRGDSTTARSFATLTVITDHGKRDQALLTEQRGACRKNKQPRDAAVSGRARLMSDNNQFTRRSLLKTAGGIALVSGISAPAILRAQTADVIKIGHLTPRTGFLGPLGEYAVMAIDLAVEEINAAGGMMGRKVELLKEDSVNPQTASTKAERMIERDKVACIIGEISSASCLTIAQVAAAQQDAVHQHRRQLRRAARQGLPALHVPRRVAELDVCQDRRPLVPARRPGQGQEVVLADGRLRLRPRPAEGRRSASWKPMAAISPATIWCRPTPPTSPPIC